MLSSKSKKRKTRMAEVRPIRERLIEQAGECEICGASPGHPHHRLPRDLSRLCCHEIANGPNRDAALDKPYAILVLCWYCNGHLVEDKSLWPEARQLAALKESRPGDYDLAAYNRLINPRAPQRITEMEVEEFIGWMTIKEVAKQFGVSREVVTAWIESGELEAVNLAPQGSHNRMLRISPDAVDEFIACRTLRDNR